MRKDHMFVLFFFVLLVLMPGIVFGQDPIDNFSVKNEELKNGITHLKKVETVWSYTVLVPEDYYTSKKSYNTCIILHGNGSNEIAHAKIAHILGREKMIYILPKALYPRAKYNPFAVEGSFSGHIQDMFYNIHLDDEVFFYSVQQYSRWIMDCFEEAKTLYRIKNEKAYIIGHSQGGAYAINCALLYPDQVESVLCYAGSLYDIMKKKDMVKQIKGKNVSINIVHCKNDPVVNFEQGVQIADELKVFSNKVNFVPLEGGSHTLNKKVYLEILKWINNDIEKTPNKYTSLQFFNGGWLGASMQFDTSMTGKYGVLINFIFENSPAEKAGIQVGERIVRMNNKEIRNFTDYSDFISATKPGQKVSIELINKRNKLMKVSVILGEEK